MKHKDLLATLGLAAAFSMANQMQHFEPRRRGRIKVSRDIKKYRKHRNRIKAIAKASRRANR